MERQVLLNDENCDDDKTEIKDSWLDVKFIYYLVYNDSRLNVDSGYFVCVFEAISWWIKKK